MAEGRVQEGLDAKARFAIWAGVRALGEGVGYSLGPVGTRPFLTIYVPLQEADFEECATLWKAYLVEISDDILKQGAADPDLVPESEVVDG